MRSDWLREFKELGVDQVRARVSASVWPEEKLQAARRWLRWQDNRWKIAAVIVGAVAAAVGATKVIIDGLN
jgi:hypothetical protein